jgi:site-specific DNA recombinase
LPKGWQKAHRILVIPWAPPLPYRRREIIQGEGDDPLACDRCEPRRARFSLTSFVTPIARRTDQRFEQRDRVIAAHVKKTERSIRMTLSLSFLSRALVKAAIEGWLSRGFGVKRLMDLPMAWSDQWSALGLKASAQT